MSFKNSDQVFEILETFKEKAKGLRNLEPIVAEAGNKLIATLTRQYGGQDTLDAFLDIRRSEKGGFKIEEKFSDYTIKCEAEVDLQISDTSMHGWSEPRITISGVDIQGKEFRHAVREKDLEQTCNTIAETLSPKDMAMRAQSTLSAELEEQKKEFSIVNEQLTQVQNKSNVIRQDMNYNEYMIQYTDDILNGVKARDTAPDAGKPGVS